MFRRSVLDVVACCAAVSCLVAPARAETDKQDNCAVPSTSATFVIHEWGTFTSLQDEQGYAIGGVNGDDEPVPEFVHRISNFLVLSPHADIPILYQGAPACHPDVTMRLETPVVYFHPAANTKLPLTLDFEVAFNAGWLSEYYPDAKVDAPGVSGQRQFGRIRPNTVGRLRWENLQVNTSADGPQTQSEVWLAPRKVQAAGVTTSGGESERFLFYRGLGHVDSPVRVIRNGADGMLNLVAEFPTVSTSRETTCAVPRLWLVDVRDRNACAFRELPGFDIPADGKQHAVGTTPAEFDESDFSGETLAKLCADMRSTLIDDGLFADEADALLNTWKVSYFQSPGLRLFYLLPRSWTNEVLPLNSSIDAKTVRTMVGRVEIVAPHQRKLLQQIASGPASKPRRIGDSEPPAADFRAYEQLGRFRNALLLDELKRRPTRELQAFVDNYGLHGYRVAN